VTAARGELIAIEGVTKRYLTSSGAVEALHDVSLSVGEGDFCTLIGPSGCGKSVRSRASQAAAQFLNTPLATTAEGPEISLG
jgi:ABC-type nitrate/sulfonate/bicarbonate transport system ATPase subunit